MPLRLVVPEFSPEEKTEKGAALQSANDRVFDSHMLIAIRQQHFDEFVKAAQADLYGVIEQAKQLQEEQQMPADESASDRSGIEAVMKGSGKS